MENQLKKISVNFGQPLIDMNQSQPKTINQQTSISTKKKNFVME